MAEPLVFRRVRVRRPIAHTFEVFTARIDLWWPRSHRRGDDARMEIEPKEGGRFLERNASGEVRELGRVLTWEPPTLLTYTWQPGAIAAPTEVEVRFTADGEETVVEVAHREAAAALGEHRPKRVALFTQGWELVLPAFVEVAEG